MNLGEERPSFMDRGTIVGFIVILVFWFGWSRYMEMKYPKAQPVAAKASQDVKSGEKTGAMPVNPEAAVNKQNAETSANPASGKTQAAVAAVEMPEQIIQFSNPSWAFALSSRGMGLRNVEIKGYQTREGKPISLSEGVDSFSTYLAGADKPVEFMIERVADDKFVGRADVGGLKIQKTITVDSSKYTLDTVVEVSGATASFAGLTTRVGEKYADHTAGSFLTPNYDYQGWVVLNEEETTREMLNREKTMQLQKANVSLAALSAHYFALAIIDRSPLLPSFSANIEAHAANVVGQLTYKPVNPTENFVAKYSAFVGPKSFELFASIDDRATRIIDYGKFAIIGRPILKLLKFIHEVIPNWGVAIILLTIIVRLIVMPFNIYSYKSMKVMQKLQPEMARIREKYKDANMEQKQQMNAEIMELMKRHNASPIGGCLPMLLQLPVFLALYQVLGQSIELYRAPFFGWITDLSAKDPYFVLPVLMGITMFINQKITPTTMDPQQAKIMQWVPLIFSVFMVSLPSGLTLYIFVSTLFGIVQQYYFTRDKATSTSAAIKEAKA